MNVMRRALGTKITMRVTFFRALAAPLDHDPTEAEGGTRPSVVLLNPEEVPRFLFFIIFFLGTELPVAIAGPDMSNSSRKE